jgi:uncharacterized protein YgbK (DUF1537 family)
MPPMSDTPTSDTPASATLDELLAGVPGKRTVDVAALSAAVQRGKKVIVFDDDPTGTQTVSDVPVLTAWTVDDIRWALRQPGSGFFVLTNTRSLSASDAEERTSAAARACAEAAALEGAEFVIASRSDSTLRGHFPLEPDVLIAEAARTGAHIDGVIVVPSYIDAGRLTIGSVQWVRMGEKFVPVGESEFARDATFGFHSSDLRDWVQEKTSGRVPASGVLPITLEDLRGGGEAHVARMLEGLRDGHVAVVDAAADEDLRVLVSALLEAESNGSSFVYRVGPSFVRARLGQTASAPIAGERLAELVTGMPATGTESSDTVGGSPVLPHGLVVVGSHTGLTTGQLDRLRETVPITEIELEVEQLRDPERAGVHSASVIDRAASALEYGTVVITTSRTLVTGADGDESLAIARLVSAALVAVVRELVERVRPAFVVAKGGITSSDIATEALGIVRGIARGTLLPGIVSLWQPLGGPAEGIPYVVFAGNVGDTDSLATVVRELTSAAQPHPAASSNER